MTRKVKSADELDGVRKQKLALLRQTNRDLTAAQAELSALRSKAPAHEVVSGTLQAGHRVAQRGKRR